MKNINMKLFLIIMIFFLNLFWEYSHAQFYISDMLIKNYNYALIRASILDVLFVSFIFLIVSIRNKDSEWINKPGLIDYLFIIVTGIIIAVLIELNAFENNKWAYKSIMPTIFGIGVSPLVQLFTTAILGLFIYKIAKFAISKRQYYSFPFFFFQ